MADPAIIRITDEADEMLMAICQISECGRSGVVDSAIRYFADAFIASNPAAMDLIVKAKENRSFTDIARDALERI